MITKADILKLGFIQSKASESVFLYKEKISILPHLPKTTIGINFNEGINHLLIYYVPAEQAVPAGVNLFVGSIENKEELKVLLRQLHIREVDPSVRFEMREHPMKGKYSDMTSEEVLEFFTVYGIAFEDVRSITTEENDIDE